MDEDPYADIRADLEAEMNERVKQQAYFREYNKRRTAEGYRRNYDLWCLQLNTWLGWG